MLDKLERAGCMSGLRIFVWVAWFTLAVHPACAALNSAMPVQTKTAPPEDPFGVASDVAAEATDDLLAWATAQREFLSSVRADAAFDVSPRLPVGTRLLIGVKNAVIQGFASRQLLRQTWADPALLPDGVTVVFLGCEPASSAFSSPLEELRWHEALRIERSTYKDLLTSELGCYDSYFTLVDKVKGFFRWTAAAAEEQPLHDLAFVMVVDDDVYVRVDELVKSLEPLMRTTLKPQRYYAGEVLTIQLRQDLGIGRDSQDKNAVPHAQYPMRHKPPFASGAHYVLSLDLVRFMAHNDRFLKGVGTLEDVSVAYWLLALRQIKPLHMPEFDNVRYTLCHHSLIAYADVTPEAIRQMHVNVRTSRSLCRGFSFTRWDKRAFVPDFPRIEESDPLRVRRQLTYQWDLLFNTTTRELVVVMTTVVTETNESVSAVYLPAKIGFAYFCQPLFERIYRELPTLSLPPQFCDDVNEDLHAMLVKSAHEAPETAHLYALPLSNMKYGASSALILVRLTPRATKWITLVECLMAAVFPDAFVLVESDRAYATWLKNHSPDFVFAAVEDVTEVLAPAEASAEPQELSARDETPPSRFRSRPRLVIMVSDSTPTQLPIPPYSAHYNRAILISAISQETYHRPERHLFLPAASSSFAYRIRHSPRNLLRHTMSHDTRALDNEVVGFCDCEDGSETASSQLRRIFVAELNAVAIPCAPQCRVSDQVPRTALEHDAEVDHCRQYQFAVVFEDRPRVPGLIGHHIVSAFLAGSIPIYYGHSPTVSWLFNPKAFIDCGTFASLRECAGYVAEVRASSDLYEAIRHEPPVTNLTAFSEVFSWHPNAIIQEAMGNDSHSSYTVGQRFRDILLEV